MCGQLLLHFDISLPVKLLFISSACGCDKVGWWEKCVSISILPRKKQKIHYIAEIMKWPEWFHDLSQLNRWFHSSEDFGGIAALFYSTALQIFFHCTPFFARVHSKNNTTKTNSFWCDAIHQLRSDVRWLKADVSVRKRTKKMEACLLFFITIVSRIA